MPQVKPDVETFARVKVIGVGGSGLNAVDHMIRSKVRGVDFIGVNTDAQDLHHSLMSKKLHIGRTVTRGLGAGMDPDLGRQAAEENKAEIEESLKGADMVFVTCGFGGGTGSGAAPVIASAAKGAGILTIAVVTKPFVFEGLKRIQIAEEGLVKLRNNVDAMIVIPNDRLLAVVDKNTSFLSAFAMCDEVLRQAVQGISDLITMPGIINVDFSDVKAIMSNSGSALMGIGKGAGDKRAEEAARLAISSPLLDMSIDGAKGVLFAVSGGEDMTMWEIQEAARVITGAIDKEAKVIFGAFHDDRLKRGEFKITVIASGFPSDGRIQKLFQNDKDKKEGAENGTEVKAKKEAADESDWEAVPAFLRRSKRG
ncbi:MAG: cell division protein FtsZ [Candidatus Niyogibacteria bacterium]|nr:MAG: cell division protein FtsZ [Candidatus Niyogibacteria bacterium]